MELRKKLDKIDQFFDNITIEEFDSILERNGIKTITSSVEKGMELLLDDVVISKFLNNNSYNKHIKTESLGDLEYSKYWDEEFLAEAV